MSDLLFGGGAGWYTAPAIIGTAVFTLRLILMLTGVVGDFDMDDATDFDTEFDTDAHADSGHAFAILSINTVAAFLMGFGWAGLAAMKGSSWGDSTFLVALTALACGAAMVWLLTLLLKAMFDLQASGNISIKQTVGAEGSVYIEIPASHAGKGKIQLVIDKRQRFYDAITEGEGIGRNARVRVNKVNNDNTLTVVAV